MSRRGRHTEREMRRWIQRRDRRGLTWRELSEESGIPLSTLQFWAKRLREAEESGFLEVDVPATMDQSGLEVALRGDLVVRVPTDFDPGHLRRVIEALSGC